jgi:beta-glucosidase
VKNAGTRPADEVVQLYARAVAPTLSMPLHELRGFERVPLQPGEERRVSFTLKPSADFTHYDVARKAYRAEPGVYEIQVGASSRDIRLAGRVRVQ